ncbi:hypothetical protein QTP70_017304 [Hemibagrus guttatus]|uniref:Ribosome-binding factor A, mitochondrial n=1 Tax=Hemibagrus guttatus TaxID=175788 RepID=A0AAE0RDY0_9TELE|nr:hypothetical protein QTP70_017304 [Hemibagrus guttatus]
MLALNGHHWMQKCLLYRHAGALATTMSKIKPESPDGYQSTSLRRTCPSQSLGVTNFHTCVCQCRDLLKKMLTNKRKKRWYENPQSILTNQSGFMKPAKKRSMEDSLRVRTLNTVLYKSISDLLSSHEVNAQLPGYNVEITKVSLLADYSVCRIYWKTSLSSDRDVMSGNKNEVKFAVCFRYLLISQQILGSVPPLVFVKDQQYAALKEVENLLKIADYGSGDDSKKLVLNEKDDESSMHTAERKRVVLGVDHDALYKQVEDYKQRSRDSSSQSTGSSSQISGSASLTREQLEMLADIRKQKLIEKKKHKAKKMKDDDITPKEFLLMRQLQKEEDEQYDTDTNSESSQTSERT